MTSSLIISARVAHQKELQRAHRFSARGRLKEAEEIYRRYAAKYPDDSQVLFNLGVLVQRRADSPAERVEALDFYQRAIAAPGEAYVKANAANNCGLIMGKINRPDKAAIFFHMALQINPANNAARLNYADCLRHEGHYEEADKEFAEIMRQDPTSDAAKFSAGMIALLLGDLKRGFELYEHRFGVASFPTKEFRTNKPKWTGQDLNGKTIILPEDQGMGDSLQFWRYCANLKKMGATVLFRGNALYRNIAKGVDGLDRFLDLDDKLPKFDFYLHLLSLPHRFGTTLKTIPANIPYIRRHPDWEPYSLPCSHRRKKVGLVWAGSPRHGKDFWRSIEPEAFQPMIDAHPQIQFYSLQCGPRAHEAARLRNVIDLAPTIADWTDTFQALEQLDELVTVDTAVLHLAGAIGRPTRALIPHSPDWRWMLSGGRTPWYPAVNLYRQPKPDDWSAPIGTIKIDIC